jgi:hypothetical protein
MANIYLLFLSGFIGNDESLTQSNVQHGERRGENRGHPHRRRDH